MEHNFIADVGGTNIRLALVESGDITSVKKYLCNDFSTIEEAINQFKQDVNVVKFSAGCIAIACPVNHDVVKMTNHSWVFSKTTLQASLGLSEMYVINDFTAVAFSLPWLKDDQVIQVGQGTAIDKGNIAVFGPGTGLGVEHLTYTSTGWQTLDGEGGHVDFSPNDENDIIIWHYLKSLHGRASAEEVMSGRGIVNIYNAFCGHKGIKPVFTDPADITTAALNNADETAYQTLQQFCRIMGAFAGNLALNLCTTGGVFVGGGIIGKLGKFFLNSEFRAYFENKGMFNHYVKDIPTFIIDEPDHGLLGALAYLTQQQSQSTK
ncbi:glucokinase [Glaciecola sp. 1036]|uniref:glucokinase n=1 Tax=Alteromonadaceae TaxID=72275 RepID=UPI003D06983D